MVGSHGAPQVTVVEKKQDMVGNRLTNHKTRFLYRRLWKISLNVFPVAMDMGIPHSADK
jgi:hypothetical protein